MVNSGFVDAKKRQSAETSRRARLRFGQGQGRDLFRLGSQLNLLRNAERVINPIPR
jgi:hypothetical protein